MSDFGHAVSAGLAAIIGLAIIAVIVSSHSQTSNVITAAGSALANLLNTAISGAGAGASGLTSTISGVGGANPLNAPFSPPVFSAANLGSLLPAGDQNFSGAVG